MEHIISEILQWCQNDKDYLQELIDKLNDMISKEEEL